MKIVTLGSRMLSPLLAEKAPLFGLWNEMGASISIENFHRNVLPAVEEGVGA